MPRMCGKEAECSTKQLILGECRCLHVDWGAYNMLLVVGALRAIEKMVPAVALDRDTPVGEWCGCRPVVRAAAEAAERRAKGEAVGEEGW